MRTEAGWGRAKLVWILLVAGCSAVRDDPRACRLTSAGVGALVGGGAAGAGVSQLDLSSHHEGGAIAGAAAGGAALGLLGGLLVAQALCEPEAAPPPPPEPAPPPPPPPAPGTPIATLLGPHFAFDQATLTPEGRARVEAAAETLARQPSTRVLVEGHTDSVGSDAYNLRLSERRARAVRDVLVEHGVMAERIEVRGVGKADPVADNATAEGRARNRRVEIIAR